MRIDISTEELSILADGGSITRAVGDTEVISFAATDLEGSLADIAAGKVARLGEIEVAYV